MTDQPKELVRFPGEAGIKDTVIAQRLLDLRGTAAYLGVSPWTVRTLEQQGLLRRVRVPLAGYGELRKLLFDRHDLDSLIEGWKVVDQ